MPELYIRNGLIVTEEQSFMGGVVVEHGKVTDLVLGNRDISAGEVIDASGKVILPGIVDAHVHYHSPGREHWEGYHTGSMAAAAGGVTTIADMPLNGIPPTSDREKLLVKRSLIKDQPVVDYCHWAGLVNDNLNALDGLHEEGVIGFKAFMSGAATEEFKRVDDDLIYLGMLKIRELGNVIALHAENEYVIAYMERFLQANGRKDPMAWAESRPPLSELEAINRSIFWARATGCRTHIVHVSLAEGTKMVARAQREGVKISVETCPHFLLLTEDDLKRLGPEAKSDPPVRTTKDVEELWQSVLNGYVDMITSDHAPCTIADKERGKDDIFKAWGGVTGIQTMLPAVLSEGVNRRQMPLTLLVRMMSANPARLLGLYPRKGSLMPGSDADITIVDLEKEWALKAEHLFNKNKHSPYVGRQFKGSVERSFVRGKTVFAGGKIFAQPGYGQLLLRMSYNPRSHKNPGSN